MDVTEDLRNVPVISVHKDNFVTVWPSLIHAINSACFIGIDVELSGLGDRKSLTLRNIDDRYSAMVEIAKSRSILSMGIACFYSEIIQREEIDTTAATDSATLTNKEQSRTFSVHIYDISLLCMNDYVVEPLSLQFLVHHGFDFNKQCSLGLPYTRGNDPNQKPDDKPSVRKLFLHLVDSKKRLVLHNGLVDLLFLYQNLYADLPVKLAIFLADLNEMFSEGIFDSKYVAEYCLHHKASYLEYLFRRSQRLNCDNWKINKAHVRINFMNYMSDFEDIILDDLRSFKGKFIGEKSDLCSNFSSHGWCSNNSQCAKSHDVDFVLDSEEEAKKSRKKRKKNNKKTVNEIAMEISEEPKIVNQVSENGDVCKLNGDTSSTLHASKIKRGSHRAGYDAFMTGYALVIYLTTVEPPAHSLLKSDLINSISNRIYLCGRDQPLIIAKSNFAKTSENHKLKKKR